MSSTQTRRILSQVQPTNSNSNNGAIAKKSSITVTPASKSASKGRSVLKNAKAGNKSTKSGTKHTHAGAFELSDEEWKGKLTMEEFAVLREGKTEDANTGKYVAHVGNGMYMCAGCGIELYESTHKFEYACGWPAFHSNRVNAVKRVEVGKGSGPKKVEIRCTGCDGHLGHVFKSKRYPGPNNERHCVNSVALRFASLSE